MHVLRFTTNFRECDLQETRRGIRTVAKIRFDGLICGEVDDRPEAIVAPVHFRDIPRYKAEQLQKLFLEEAKLKLDAAQRDMCTGDSMWISEYARQLINIALNQG